MAGRALDVKARAFAAVVSVVLLGAAASPVVRAPTDDGFPLSTYPMFAAPRGTVQSVDYAVGMTATFGRRTLRVAHLGTGEVLAAVALLDRAMNSTPAEMAGTCQRIAARVAADPGYRDVVAIRMVRGTHDAVAYLREGKVGDEVERMHCLVLR